MARTLVFCVSVLKIIVCPFFLRPLYCLSFCDLRILNTPLVFSKLSYQRHTDTFIVSYQRHTDTFIVSYQRHTDTFIVPSDLKWVMIY